jgi:hypothetical protein
VLRGRQLVFPLLDSLKTVDQTEAVHCLNHLGELVLESDALQGFLTKWNVILDGMSCGRPASVLLRDALYNKIRERPSMADDARYNDRFGQKAWGWHLREARGVRRGGNHQQAAAISHFGAGRPDARKVKNPNRWQHQRRQRKPRLRRRLRPREVAQESLPRPLPRLCVGCASSRANAVGVNIVSSRAP